MAERPQLNVYCIATWRNLRAYCVGRPDPEHARFTRNQWRNHVASVARLRERQRGEVLLDIPIGENTAK